MHSRSNKNASHFYAETPLQGEMLRRGLRGLAPHSPFPKALRVALEVLASAPDGPTCYAPLH